jgi:hypothetical protein
MQGGEEIVAVGFYGSGMAPAAVGIEICTASIWAHTWAETGHGTIIDATGAHGVAERERFNPPGPPWATWWDRYQLTAPLATRQALYRRLATQIGRPYDTDWICAYHLNRNWQDDDAWVCSELIGWSLQAEGVLMLPDKLRRVTPGQLRRAMQVSTAFERM